MYKVLFTDDEILTREAVAENTPWEEAGFTLIGTAQDGREAISLMEKEEPSLLITDICMPVMDGLELAAYVREHFPSMKVIILSGYDEFAYAKRALQYGVSEYILKPITSIELKEELEKIRTQLDKENRSRTQIEKLQQDYEKNRPLLRERLLNQLLEGRGREENLQQQLEEMEIDLKGKRQAVLLIGANNEIEWKQEHPDITPELMQFILYNAAQELVGEEDNAVLFRNPAERSILVLARETDEELREAVARIGAKVNQAFSQYMNLKLCVVVGKTVSSPRAWKDSYESACRTEGYRYLFDNGGLLYAVDFEEKDAPSIRTALWSDDLVLAIKTGNQEEITEKVHDYFTALRQAECQRGTLQIYIQNCVLTIWITLEERGTLQAGEYGEEGSFIKKLQEYRHLSDIEEAFLKFALSLSEKIARKRDTGSQALALRALDYMEKNYMRTDLSLNTVCEYLAVSVSYFSMIFKTEAKETFVEALTRIRMEKARQILETTSLKNYEVAEKVGYNDPHYFSATFKKQVGMTPTEYAKKMRG